MRPFLNVTLVPLPVSNAAPLAVVPPLASMSRPSKVTLLASLSNWRTLLPLTPLNVTYFVPDASVCGVYTPAPTWIVAPAAAAL